jgi:hypothetical protein
MPAKYSRHFIFTLFAIIAGAAILLYGVHGYRGIIYESVPSSILMLGMVAVTLGIIQLRLASMKYQKHIF